MPFPERRGKKDDLATPLRESIERVAEEEGPRLGKRRVLARPGRVGEKVAAVEIIPATHLIALSSRPLPLLAHTRRVGWVGLTARRFLTRPPTGTPRRAISPGEGLQIFSTLPYLRGAARLSFTARIEGAHSDRAASASKKDGLATPFPPFSGRALREQETDPTDPSHTFFRMCPILFFLVRKYFTFAARG